MIAATSYRRAAAGPFKSITRRSFVSSAKLLNGATTDEIKVPIAALNPRTVTSDPTIQNFFKYTWGTWLHNDAAEKVKRETPFNVLGLVEVLNSVLEPADPATPIEIKTVASLSEGKHHKVYKIDVAHVKQAPGATPQPVNQYVLRIPYPGLGSHTYLSERLKSEVATMDFVQRALVDTGKVSFHVPKVLAWATNPKKTPVEAQFILEEHVDGAGALMRWWEPGSHDIAAKQRILQPIVNAYAGLVSHVNFSKYGSLYFTEDVESSLQNDLFVADQDSVPKDLLDRYRIGPTTEAQFWKNSLPASSPLRGPFNDPMDYIKATGSVLVEGIKKSLESYSDPAIVAHLKKQLATAERYANVAPQLLLESELDPALFSARMAHPDLNPLSFLTDAKAPEDLPTATTTLIDWESTAIKPFLLHGTPFFARHDGLKIFSLEEIPDYEKLSAQDKYSVNHFLALTQNQFSFEYMLMQASELGKSAPGLINAFAPVNKRRERPIHTAQTKAVADPTGTSPEYLDLDEDLIQLSQDWEQLRVGRPSPVTFTQAQLEEHAKDFAEYSREIVKNPFIGSKGWIPQDLFERLLGDGTIVRRDDNNYDINYKWELNN
ncbi:uncharacterized protein SAPINGB_P004877 [Magnusiomyces paraingens]|uniref:Aminoglycoside phosphotransferase domain-containing protein n=1 Tax=Magnusiomyces paraingens TaxID=2606893 RepID=A0A5E8BXJ2_9ASCO|nr:uncharacterized protein SAPINGB_P004877 [Saprochaete ingens]VVT56174.1 unnamed protein product [Saprochaete ingens]